MNIHVYVCDIDPTNRGTWQFHSYTNEMAEHLDGRNPEHSAHSGFWHGSGQRKIAVPTQKWWVWMQEWGGVWYCKIASHRPRLIDNPAPWQRLLHFTWLGEPAQHCLFVFFTIVSNAFINLLQNGWPETFCVTVSKQDITHKTQQLRTCGRSHPHAYTNPICIPTMGGRWQSRRPLLVTSHM